MHKLMKVPIALGLAALAGGVITAEAEAQVFNFRTTGYFTSAIASCNQANPGAIFVECTNPVNSLNISFTGRDWTADGGFLSGSNVTYGNFAVSGTGSGTPTGDDLEFTMVIHQILPNNNTGVAAGFMTGTLSRPGNGENFSSLVWRPNEFVAIDPVMYQLFFDNGTDGIQISAVGSTDIRGRAVVASVPEPVSMILLGTGLFGVVGVAQRRRRLALEA